MEEHRLDKLFTDRLDDLTALRRELHGMPELCYQERRTQALLKERLRALGLRPRAAADTGLVADTRPELPPALALRADMDGLPLSEETGLPWASCHKGRMHACGHDGHMAILMGTSLALARAQAPVNVRLLFQPAEEGEAGAMAMIRDGALDGVEEIYGLHNWPDLPLGQAAVTDGAVMAACVLFTVDFEGQGGHGSQPQSVRDPIVAAAQFVTGAQNVVARHVHPREAVVISFGSIHGGTTGNIIPDRVRLEGTMRCMSEEVALLAEQRLRAIAESAGAMLGVRAKLDWRPIYPVTRNHPPCARRVRRALRELPGLDESAEDPFPCMGAEDFSFYLQRVPGAFFFLGSGRAEGPNPGVHAATYDFNDDAIVMGVRVFLHLVEQVAGLRLA